MVGMKGLEEGADSPMMLDAGRFLDARRHVNPVRPDANQGVANIVRRQSSGKNDGAPGRHARSPFPVD
jgi:hypothetical protein